MKNLIGKVQKIDAIISLVGGQLTQKADGTVVYHDGQAPPTESEVDAEVKRLEKEHSDQAYARARKPLYPDIGDQLDDLYHKDAFSAEMAAKIKKVKDDNPKG